jgi:integrase
MARSKDAVEFTPAQQKALDIIARHSPEMLRGEQGLTMSDEDILAICQDLSRCPSAEKRERFNFVARGIEWGNRYLDWDIPLSPFFHSVNREKNLLQPNIYLNQHKAENLAVAFCQDLEKRVPESHEEYSAQILFSAIFFGGLLDSRWYQAYLQSLKLGNIFQSGTWLWVEMERHFKRKGSHSEHKRWVADPLTQLLIYRYLNNKATLPKNHSSISAWKVLRNLLHTLHLPGSDTPDSLSELRNWGIARNLHYLPGSSIGYATGNLTSTSLPIAPWLRIMTGKMIPVKRTEIRESHQQKINAAEIIQNTDTSITAQLALFEKARKLISVKDTEKEITAKKGRALLHSFIKEHQGELAPALQLFIHWSIQLLSKRVSVAEHRKSSALKVRSVLRYWAEIGAPLIRSFGSESPLNMDPLDLEDIYAEIALRLENSPYSVGRLGQFHAYLEVFYRAAEIEWGDLVDDKGQIVTRVDANLICPSTYEAILDSLGWNDAKRDRWQTLYIIATILVYRCGLRPGEIRALRLIDIQGISKFEVIVRNTRFKTTKSAAGVRRIPISAFAPQEELSFILGFWESRKAESNVFGDQHLLAHPTQKEGMLSDESIFDPIREIIRKVTKDETLRFYHLRHSFLTFNNIAFLLEDNISKSGVFALEHDQFSPARCKKMKSNLMLTDAAAQKQQYILAMFAGHSSPRTSNKHYIHLSDWALAYQLRHPGYPLLLSHTAIQKISGLSRPRVFELLKSGKDDGQHMLVPFIESRATINLKKLAHPLVKKSQKGRKPAPKINTANVSPLPEWAEIIGRQEEFGLNLDKLSRPDWDLAAKVYENVRNMDGRRRKTAIINANDALDSFSTRWGGYVCSTYSSASKLVEFIQLCGIKKSSIYALHHPRRNQAEEEYLFHTKRWCEKMGIPLKQVSIGENANARDSVNRGLLTIKILISNPDLDTRTRKPKSAVGFINALKIINIVANQSIND